MSNCRRRDFLKTSSLSAAGLALAGRSVAKAMGRMRVSRPNLLFVFPDQFRVQALGFRGEDPVITPNLDRFASESMFFSNAVSNRPLCTPFRGMLVTGRWPHSIGMTTNCNSSVPDNYLRESERTITDVLSESGYSVGYIGKWHMDVPPGPRAPTWQEAVWDCYTPPGPKRHGIDYWYAYGTDNKHFTPHYWIQNAPEDQKTELNEYSAEHETKIACNYIRNTNGQRDPNKPFSLIVSMNPPHPRYQEVPDKYRTYYEGKRPEDLLNRPNVPEDYERARKNVLNYFAAVTAIDHAFGKILAALEESGQADNTIVVFCSDHGEMMGSHGLMQKIVPYEEAFRIPLIIRWPGEIKPGTEDLHINVPDYMPTLLSLMGLSARIPAQVEGTDYSPVLLGQDMPRPKSAFYLCDSDYYQKEIDIKRGVRTDQYTFVVEKQEDGTFTEVLYDNKEDPYQIKSVAEERPEVAAELRMELTKWLRHTHDPYADQFITNFSPNGKVVRS